MLISPTHITKKLSGAFTERQASVMAETLVEIHDELVKIKDFRELKDIVQRIGERTDQIAQVQHRIALAQERTEQRFSGLEVALEKLAQAQERTEQRVEALAQAQERTEQRFSGLEVALEKLAQAQERTEQRVEALAQAQERTEQQVEALAQAQERTEQRVEALAQAQERTEQRVEALAQAQERTEQQVEALAQAQERTEQRVEALAQAQERTEQQVEALAQAQERTEQLLQNLIVEHDKTRKDLGGLSMAFGYSLEDKAYIYLPNLLQERYGITVQGDMRRTFVTDKHGQNLEVNIYAEALQDGTPITIIGECKSQLSTKKIDSFLRKRIERFEGVFPAIAPVLITYMASAHDVEAYAQTQGCLLFYSYELK